MNTLQKEMFWLAFSVHFHERIPKYVSHTPSVHMGCEAIQRFLWERNWHCWYFATALGLNSTFHSRTMHASTPPVHSSSGLPTGWAYRSAAVAATSSSSSSVRFRSSSLHSSLYKWPRVSVSSGRLSESCVWAKIAFCRGGTWVSHSLAASRKWWWTSVYILGRGFPS